jgi:glycosyltransferase involved in cell wall biosynthesis
VSSSARPRLVVATSFAVWPPRGGGQARIFGLYAALARLGVDVEIVALVARGEHGGTRTIAPGVRQIRVPKTVRHDQEEYRLHVRAGVPVTDMALALHHALTPAYGEALAAAAEGAAAVVASHPFAQPALAAATDAPLIYEAHNVETDLKASMLAGSDAPDELTQIVRDVEGACCATAAHTIVCKPEDGARLGELFGLAPERVVVVPNGVDPAAVPYTTPREREARKRALGLADTFQALFLGSWHEPNLVAVRDILAAAEALPDVRFLVVGSAGLAFAGEHVSPNADLCGVVDGGFVRSVLALADVALNPMRLGSGTNLKMLDYALAGVPVLSTEFGARGLGLGQNTHFRVIERDADGGGPLAAAIAALRAEPPEVVAERARAAHDRVAERFAWDAIASAWRAHPAMRELVEGAVAA